VLDQALFLYFFFSILFKDIESGARMSLSQKQRNLLEEANW
jgi:hypothetical protein